MGHDKELLIFGTLNLNGGHLVLRRQVLVVHAHYEGTLGLL